MADLPPGAAASTGRYTVVQVVNICHNFYLSNLDICFYTVGTVAEETYRLHLFSQQKILPCTAVKISELFVPSARAATLIFQVVGLIDICRNNFPVQLNLPDNANSFNILTVVCLQY